MASSSFAANFTLMDTVLVVLKLNDIGAMLLSPVTGDGLGFACLSAYLLQELAIRAATTARQETYFFMILNGLP